MGDDSGGQWMVAAERMEAMTSCMEASKMTAVISECGRYRYRLGRPLVGITGVCIFIMLNPSTADASVDDPTIRKCMSYARSWGFARLEVVNLFAWRATNPLALAPLTFNQATGPDNDAHIRAALAEARLVVGAWGNGKGASVGAMVCHRQRVVRDLVADAGHALHRLGPLTSSSNPRHPLYLRGDLKPEIMP